MTLPSWRYHRTEEARIAETEAEHDALHAAGYRESPDADFPDDDATEDAPPAPAPTKRKR